MNDAPRTELDPQRPVVESVPDGYAAIRFWVFLLIIWSGVCLGFGAAMLIASLSQGAKAPTSAAVFLLVVAVVELAIWAFALHLWTKVRLTGFWMVSILAHLGLLAAALGSWSASQPGMEYVGPRSYCMLVFFLVCLLINIWSKETHDFFTRINGRCPLCHVGSLRNVKHKLDWVCPSCHQTILWRQKGRLTVRCPQCRKKLRGATTEMIGDTAVCPSCREEFEISESKCALRTPQPPGADA